MKKILNYLIIAAFFYLMIAAYGAEREFETALNAGNEVTPALLAQMYEALRWFVVFVVFVFTVKLK
jgi:hypothetical protein